MRRVLGSVNMDLDRRDNDACKACPFSEPGKGAASDPVYQNPPSDNDADCFAKTGNAFLFSLDAASTTAPNRITEDGCKALAAIGDGGQIFQALYELDHTYCGLGNFRTIGDDPTVNSILTNCSSQYGIENLVDPGWPASTYQCTLCTYTPQAQSATSSSDASSTPTSTPPDNKAATSQVPTPSGQVYSSTPTTAATTSSANPTALPQASSTLPSAASVIASPSNQIPAQGIVAIVVCTTLAIAAAATLLFCVLRRRRRQQEAMYPGAMSSRITTSGSVPPRADTYEPLISPSHSLSGDRPPLTPPPRLRDRKLLLAISRSDDPFNAGTSPFESTHQHSTSSLYSPAQSPQAHYDGPLPLSPSTGQDSSSPFPSSSICAPTRTNKLEPRPERTSTMQAFHSPTASSTRTPHHNQCSHTTRLRSPPPVSFTFPPRRSASLDTITGLSRSPAPPSPPTARKSNHRRGTAAFRSSSNAYASLASISDASSALSFHTHHYQSPSTATNPDPRSFLASPTPPPPPPRPMRPHEAPLEIPDLVRPSQIGIARTTMAGLGGSSSISLQSLVEEGRRDRDSWGSWEGRSAAEEEEGGSGPGVAGRLFGVSFPAVARGG